MKLGVIGVGNMGAAIIKGYIAGGVDPKSVCVCGHNPERTAVFARETGVTVCENITALTQECGTVMIAVKPKDVRGVFAEMAAALTADKVIVSIAAGLSITALSEMASGANETTGTERNLKIVRVMPNTPSMVGAGMSALCLSLIHI